MMERGDCTLGERKGQSKGTYIDCPPEATGFVLPHLNFTVTYVIGTDSSILVSH